MRWVMRWDGAVHRFQIEITDFDIGAVQHRNSGQFAPQIIEGNADRQFANRGEFRAQAENREGGVAEIDAQIEQAAGDGGNQAFLVRAEYGNQCVLGHRSLFVIFGMPGH
jgi:hypothetical protein